MATHVWETGSKDGNRTAFDELTEIAHRVQTFANASGAAIGLRVGTTDEIVCCARSGPSARDVGAIMGAAGSFAGLCIKSGKGLLCEDTETDARVDSVSVRALGIRSMVVTPVKEGNQVVGVLAVFSPFPSAFTSIHLAVMKTSTDQIAAFLQKSRQKPDAAYEPAPTAIPVAVPKAVPAPAEPVVTPAAVVHPVTIEPVPAPTLVIAAPVAVKAVAAGAEAHASIIAPAESSKPVRDTPIRAVTNSAAFWSGAGSAAAAPAPAYRPESVTTVLAEEVKAVAIPARTEGIPKRKKEEAHAKQKQHHASLGTLNSLAAQNKKPRTALMLAGVAAVAVTIAGGTFAFLKLHKAAPPTVAQHVQEASSQPTPVQPAPVQPTSAPAGSTSDSQPSVPPVTADAATKNPTPPAVSTSVPAINNASSASAAQNRSGDGAKKPVKPEKPSAAQPEKRAPETVALANGPSRINGARTSDSGQQDAAPALGVGGGPALGNLSALSSSGLPSKPSVITESNVEPIQTLKKVSPIYPSIARARGITRAELVVLARVGKDGQVSNVRLVSGDPIFFDAVVTAVKQWQFRAARLNGQPIEQDHQIKVKFGQ